MTRAADTLTITDAQIARALDLALGWRRCGNGFAARLKLHALRGRLRGEQRDALDMQLRKHKIMRAVTDTEIEDARFAQRRRGA